MRIDYRISPRKIGFILGVIALILALQSLVSEYAIENILNSDYSNPVVLVIDLFSVNTEETIPTWYSTILLFMAACGLAVIATGKRAEQDVYARHWIGLAVIFVYLSIDEGAAIHDILAEPLQKAFSTTGFLAFGWQIVAAPLLIIFALVYLRFLLQLPPRTRNLFILAGGLYVGGALIIEGISANQWSLDGGVSFGYLTIATVEELFEMWGVVIFIYALLDYLVNLGAMITLQSLTEAAQEPMQSTALSGLRSALVPILLVCGGLAVMNVVLLSWARAYPSDLLLVEEDFLSSTDIFVNELAGQDVLVTRLPGAFSLNSSSSLQLAASYTDLYAALFVVSLPADDTTIMIAGDSVPFDQNGLMEMLQTSGLSQFVIFDAAAIEPFVSKP